jgi:hypothetical protein
MAAGQGSALRSLLAYFRIEVDQSQLKTANNALDAFTGRLKTVARTAAVAFVVVGFRKFVDDQIEAANQLKITADRIGTTTDQLQALNLLAQETGVPVDALANGFRFLNRHLGEISEGKGKAARQEFQKLGIHVKDAEGKTRPAVDVMADLADKLQTIPSAADRTNIAMTLLGRGGAQLTPILEQGGKAFKNAAQEMQLLGGGMSNEFVEAAHEARAAGVRLDFALTGLKSTIVAALLPGLKDGYEWLSKITINAIKYGKETTWLSSTILAFKTVLAALAVWWALANIPIVAGAAALTAIYIAFDDLYAFLSGNESIIGDTLNHFLGMGKAVEYAHTLNESFYAMIDLIKIVGGEIKDDILLPLQYAWKMIHGDTTGASQLADEAAARTQQRAEILADLTNLSKAQRDKKYKEGSYAPGGANNTEEGVGTSRVNTDDKGNPLPGQQPTTRTTIYGDVVPIKYNPRSSPLPQPGPAAGNTVHQSNTFNVKVDAAGAKDPKAVGSAVGAGIATEQQRVNSQTFTPFHSP